MNMDYNSYGNNICKIIGKLIAKSDVQVYTT